MPIGKGGGLSWLRRLLGVEPAEPTTPPADAIAEEYTRPATSRDMITTLRLLDRAGVRYVSVGGYALAGHG